MTQHPTLTQRLNGAPDTRLTISEARSLGWKITRHQQTTPSGARPYAWKARKERRGLPPVEKTASNFSDLVRYIEMVERGEVRS